VSPTTAKVHRRRSSTSPHLDRLVAFAEPGPADECLTLDCGSDPLPAALSPLVRRVTAADAVRPADHAASDPPGPPSSTSAPPPGGRMPTVVFSPARHRGDGAFATAAEGAALPYRDGAFTLVVSRLALRRPVDPASLLRETVRVCRPGGRVVIAEVVRPAHHAPARDRLERLRDPAHPGLPALDDLVRLLTDAGARIRRLERINVERPLEHWLADATDPAVAEEVRRALLEEIDGGSRTGARPRVIGGELWYTDTWAYLAAEPRPR